MQKRPLGRSGLAAAPLVLGCNVFGWTADEATSFAILDRFVEHGFDLIDTANVYSSWVEGHDGGESERIIGKWLAQGGRRERVLVATKVGHPMTVNDKGLGRAAIEKHVDASLSNSCGWKCMPTPNISRITPISASCWARSASATKPGVNGPTTIPASM